MSSIDEFLRSLTSRNLVIIGLVLIIIGNAFTATFLSIRINELIASVGALFLVVGTLHWFFDEESRQQLVAHVTDRVGDYLDRRDNLAQHGIVNCLLDSKTISDYRWEAELIDSQVLAIGIHYSDGTVARYERIIQSRIAKNKITQIAHSKTGGISQSYLENCLANPIKLTERLGQLQQVITARFGESPYLKLLEHDRVLRYAFNYCERALWIIFSTNTDSYQPHVPALRINAGSELFDFFKSDISRLGVAT